MKDMLGESILAAKNSGHDKSFREGISLEELFKMFSDDQAAEKWFEGIMWKDGRPCPYCFHPDTKRTDHKPTVPYRCMRCHGHFSVKTGTVMHRSKLGYQKWAIAVYMFATSLKGVSSIRLHHDLHITQKSAWFMGQRLREAWRALTEADGMAGPMEVDESYINGKEKNKHSHKKGQNPKVAVVGVEDRTTGKMAAKPIPETTQAQPGHFVESKAEEAKIYTDENPSYGGLSHHSAINHSAGEYVRGYIHINGMESFWALLKRGHYGIYRKMSKEHLHRYVNEFAGRHNICPDDPIYMMDGIIQHMSGKRLTYRALIKNGTQAMRLLEMAA